jgi:hypothetical protein
MDAVGFVDKLTTCPEVCSEVHLTKSFPYVLWVVVFFGFMRG